MRSQSDDREARSLLAPKILEAGFEIVSFRGIDEGDYWIHVRKEALK
ncbi:MAG: hypothetical protein LVQ63_06995 [Thermoplasmatales archaeon]|nr:hypothetical protein [Thermoplasmatales archaeon]